MTSSNQCGDKAFGLYGFRSLTLGFEYAISFRGSGVLPKKAKGPYWGPYFERFALK